MDPIIIPPRVRLVALHRELIVRLAADFNAGEILRKLRNVQLGITAIDSDAVETLGPRRPDPRAGRRMTSPRPAQLPIRCPRRQRSEAEA